MPTGAPDEDAAQQEEDRPSWLHCSQAGVCQVVSILIPRLNCILKNFKILKVVLKTTPFAYYLILHLLEETITFVGCLP